MLAAGKGDVSPLVNSFIVQYLQHNPSKAPFLKSDKVNPMTVTDKDGTVTKMYSILDTDKNTVRIPLKSGPEDMNYYYRNPIIKQMDDDGRIKLYGFQEIEGLPFYVSIDKAGDARYNFREYRFNLKTDTLSSLILKNISGGKRAIQIKELMDQDANKNPAQDPNAIINLLTTAEFNLNKLRTVTIGKDSSYKDDLPNHITNYLRYLGNINLYDVAIIPEAGMDKWTFGTYDKANNYISLNADYVKQYGVSNLPRVLETLNHEFTHAAIDRAVTAWLNPLYRVKDENDTEIEFITEQQRMALNSPMMMISNILSFMHEAMGNSKSKHYKLLKNVADKYKAAQEAGDHFTMKDLAFYPAVIQRMQQFVKSYGAESLQDMDNFTERQREAYSEIMREFVAYFMTNADFQDLLNKVKLEKADGKELTIWQQIVKAFIDILDAISNGLSPLSQTEKSFFKNLDDNTLAHAAARASIDLLNTTTAFRESNTYDVSKIDKSRYRVKERGEMSVAFANMMAQDDNGFIVVEGINGVPSEYDNVRNAFVFPVKKSNSNEPSAFYTEADIPQIEALFEAMITKAKDYGRTFAMENIGFADIVDYEQRNKKVAKAIKSGFVKLRQALDNKSKNAIELIDVDNDLYAPVIVTKIADNVDKILRWSKIKGINLWDKIQKDLGIPKNQVELLQESPGTTLKDKLMSFVASYSYTININTAIEGNDYGVQEVFNDQTGLKQYSVFKGLSMKTLKIFDTEEEATRYLQKQYNNPTQYYSNYTVPGGTNYTENEIVTPVITPIIKGHAAFSTPNGIGWFRSDERQVNFGGAELSEEYKPDIEQLSNGKWEVSYLPIVGGRKIEFFKTEEEAKDFVKSVTKTSDEKTRRILELQSDLFQKGRNEKDLITKIVLKGDTKYGTVFLDAQDEWDEVQRIGQGQFSKEYLDELKSKIDKAKTISKINTSDNQFLQLLNKDNNWATFFVKSIVRDSIKKGYETVLFPKGDTASKVEGHSTLLEFKKKKQYRIDNLENYKVIVDEAESSFLDNKYNVFKYKIIREGTVLDRFKTRHEAEKEANNINNPIQLEINTLKEELEKVEREGFAALKPIYKFYEETVGNILKKQYKGKVSEITDEYGNGWYSVDLDNEMANVPPRNLDLIKDLLDFKFDMAEVEEVSAYKNCTI